MKTFTRQQYSLYAPRKKQKTNKKQNKSENKAKKSGKQANNS